MPVSNRQNEHVVESFPPLLIHVLNVELHLCSIKNRHSFRLVPVCIYSPCDFFRFVPPALSPPFAQFFLCHYSVLGFIFSRQFILRNIFAPTICMTLFSFGVLCDFFSSLIIFLLLVVLLVFFCVFIFMHVFTSRCSAEFGSSRGGDRNVSGPPVSNGAVELPPHRALHSQARHRAHGLGQGLHEHGYLGSLPRRRAGSHLQQAAPSGAGTLITASDLDQ